MSQFGARFDRGMKIGELLVELGVSVIKAIRRGDVERVEEVLPHTLLTSLERAKGELEAAEKFGPRGTPTEPAPPHEEVETTPGRPVPDGSSDR